MSGQEQFIPGAKIKIEPVRQTEGPKLQPDINPKRKILADLKHPDTNIQAGTPGIAPVSTPGIAPLGNTNTVIPTSTPPVHPGFQGLNSETSVPSNLTQVPNLTNPNPSLPDIKL